LWSLSKVGVVPAAEKFLFPRGEAAKKFPEFPEFPDVPILAAAEQTYGPERHYPIRGH
jgi:hypothetical protein